MITEILRVASERDISAIGDFSNLTSTAAVMLKTSIFSAWAELQCASAAQPYLGPLVRPYMEILCRAWLATLREYARLRCDVDSVAGSSSPSSSHAVFDSSFSGLSREAALPVSILRARLKMLSAKPCFPFGLVFRASLEADVGRFRRSTASIRPSNARSTQWFTASNWQ